MQVSRDSSPLSAQSPGLLAEINVTPLVDVMLVLLIVFMITAPLAASGVDVDLPQGNAKTVAADSEPIEISIDAQGRIFIGRAEVEPVRFAEAIGALAHLSPDVSQARVFVRADRTLDYGYVLGIVNTVSAAGFSKVAFLSEPEAAAPGNRQR